MARAAAAHDAARRGDLRRADAGREEATAVAGGGQAAFVAHAGLAVLDREARR
jgi:hypothetical protein